MRALLLAVVLLVAACSNPAADCQRAAGGAQKMTALAEQHRDGCTLDSDCVVFPLSSACGSGCDAVVLQSSAALLQSQLNRLSETECVGLTCRTFGDCFGPVQAACRQGRCVNGTPDGG